MAIIFFNENIVDEYKEISDEDKSIIKHMDFVGANYFMGLSLNLKKAKSELEQEPIVEDEIQESTIVMNVVKINNQVGMTTKFLHQIIPGEYQKVSEEFNKVEEEKPVKKKSMKELMNQSVFHGRNWRGSNFIA